MMRNPFVTDTRDFKIAMHALIDHAYAQKLVPPTKLRDTIADLVRQHRLSLNPGEYASQIYKCLLAANPRRAHKLVDVFGDREYTWVGAIVLGVGKWCVGWLIRLTLLAAFVVMVIWLYLNMAGGR